MASEKGDLLGSLLGRFTLGAYALFPRFQGSAESQSGNVVDTDNNPNTTIDHVHLFIWYLISSREEIMLSVLNLPNNSVGSGPLPVCG